MRKAPTGTDDARNSGTMSALEYDSVDALYDVGLHYDSVATRERRGGRMIKPKLELDRQTDKDLESSAINVKDSMTDNAAEFPDSTADVTALGTAITAYTAALQTAANGKIAQQALVDAKDASRADVEDILRTLAGQVHNVAKGDV